MSVEDLPNGFTVPTRDEAIAKFKRDYQLAIPGAPVGDGSLVDADAHVITDTLAPLYANAFSAAQNAERESKTLEGLKAEARTLGIPELLPASSARGFVEINAATGGVVIDAGQECKVDNTLCVCSRAGTYTNDTPVPIVSVDVGPGTNLSAGTVLTWTSPPLGLAAKATVLADSNGAGLTGGRAEESRDELLARIIDTTADPAVAANVAKLRKLVKDASVALGIAIQEVFVYPCIGGGGVTSYCFTLRPSEVGGGRAPSELDRAAIHSVIANGFFPDDDGLLPTAVVEIPLTAKVKIDWAPGITGWVDTSPWPVLADDFRISAVTDSLTFRVQSDATTPTAPSPGATFAFYNDAAGKFLPKRILTATALGGGGWDIVCDASNSASDTTFTPAIDDRFCPWSDNLDALVSPLLTEFGKLGPGEQSDDLFDAGNRIRRNPASLPTSWPYTVRYKNVDAIGEIDVVGDVQWDSPSLPYATPIGTAGVSSNLIVLGTLLAFPLS